jgi:hypothetical protein
MTSQLSNLGKFNKTIDDFAKNLLEALGEHPYSHDIQSYKNKLETLIKVNPRKVLEGFMLKVYPYKMEIMSKDERFFLRRDYSNDLNGQNEIIESLKIKEIWENDASENVKKTIWTYFQVLIILAEQAILK